MNPFLAVFIGGGLGSILRYSLSLWLGKHSSGFPTATFVANILSCVVLALAWLYVEKHINLDEGIKLLVLVGFCGGFSTFSTFSLETFRLMEEGKMILASIYVLASVSTCLAVLGVIFSSSK
ncbi:MAG: fluoride efflux transporter CrcB [Bacteroidota bacterium]